MAGMQQQSAWIGLGANLGDARRCLAEALRCIDAVPGVRVAAVSSLYRTEPIDAEGPDFTNAVARVETELSPLGLLSALQEIELRLGRVRPVGIHNAPRTIDLDIELFGNGPVSDPSRLVVPHPRMHERRFVLEPLLEVSPDARIPGKGAAADFLPGVLSQRLERIGPFDWRNS